MNKIIKTLLVKILIKINLMTTNYPAMIYLTVANINAYLVRICKSIKNWFPNNQKIF